MVKRKILYYPTIAIPSEWLRSTILYWDKISSIMPRDWEDIVEDSPQLRKGPYSEYIYDEDIEAYKAMKLLKDEGQYEPCRPEEKYISIGEEFKHILDSNLYREKKPVISNRILSMKIKAFQPFGTVSGAYQRIYKLGRIHKDKMSQDVLDLLLNRDLVSEDEYDSNWYFVEGDVSLLYMALLAKCLAYNDQDYTVIGTDWEEYETLLFRHREGPNSFPSINASFFGILPVPEANVPIEKILKFKEKRSDELYNPHPAGILNFVKHFYAAMIS